MMILRIVMVKKIACTLQLRWAVSPEFTITVDCLVVKISSSPFSLKILVVIFSDHGLKWWCWWQQGWPSSNCWRSPSPVPWSAARVGRVVDNVQLGTVNINIVFIISFSSGLPSSSTFVRTKWQIFRKGVLEPWWLTCVVMETCLPDASPLHSYSPASAWVEMFG